MRICAIISEFNPFHNGHKYLIDTLKSNEDTALVAIMSGSFVERGDVSVIDKYARAEAAVKCGADLVLELPAPWCFSGAEFFALGGVSIAKGLGIVDTLAFGSESGDITELWECARRLISPEFLSTLENERASRRSIGIAALRAEVYAALFGETDILNGSNNLLALEYLHALETIRSDITPITVKRIGADFNSEELCSISSASAIRSAVRRNIRSFSQFMPRESEDILMRELDMGRAYDLSRLDTAVIAMLLTAEPSHLSETMEISGGFENKLCNAAFGARGIDELVDLVKSKHYSASRVRRAIISAILGVKMSDVDVPPEFTYLLAANERGRQVLSRARKNAEITVLSKISDGKFLSGLAARQYELHMRAERLAELCCMGEPRKVGAVML